MTEDQPGGNFRVSGGNAISTDQVGPTEAQIRYQASLPHHHTNVNEVVLLRILDGEREARHKCEVAMRANDAAMGVMWNRLAAAGVDCSDLVP